MSEPTKAVFLSYASQDAEAVRRIADALRAAGLEVWFDQNELVGGDAWDAKIRQQIKECALFVPVISANTQARAEGYFRLEWKLAVDRSHLMADDAPFLFPVVIDDTADATARVPDRFRAVQWTRLNIKDTPETLAARVARLLSGAGASLDHARGSAVPEARRPATPLRKNPPAWLRYAWIGVGLLFAVIYAVRPPWQPAGRAGSKPTTPAAPSPSEARQLIGRAGALSLEKYDSTADDYATAEGLLKQALSLDQNDPEVWAFSSLFNSSIRTRGFDHAPVRREMARRDAERALKLAPDSPDALFALGRAQRDFEPDAAEQTFKKILGRQPDDFRALGNLASIYDYNGRPDEAVAIYERIATADPAHEALTRYTEYLSFFHYARFAEAERCIRRSVAIQPSANSQAGLAMLLLTWKGEADEAARVLATGPTAARNEPRTIWTTAFVDLCRRAPDDTLRTLDRLADDFIQDNWFTGPKAYFAGRAHALAGRTEAARIAWESALAVTDAHLKDTPADVGLHVMRGELLAFLGQPDEALREARAVAELGRGNPRDDRYWFISPALIYAVLGRADDALPLLEKICAPPKGQIVGWPLTPALLRLDPLWDKLRGDPRFQELCAEPAATEPQSVAVPAASQPPVDPDLQRAAHLLESTESIAADITLAEDLVKGVLAAHPTDPAATIMMARVQTYILVRGFDRSEDRFAAAKRFSERALALAPEDPDALASMAVYLYRRGVELPRAQKLLRQAIARRPTEPYYYRMLDNVLSIDPNETDATIIANALETARRFPADALVQYELGRHYRDAGQLAEAEHCYDLAIKLGPVANAIIGRARLKLFVHGDPAGMRQLLDTLPDNYRGTDRAVFSEFTLATATGTPEKGLEALQALPEPWMIDFDYTGPTDLLRGELLLQEGKPELAQIRFAEALAELHRHKVDISRNFSTTWLETWLLMRLGRRDEARARNAVFLPELARPYRIYLGSNWWFNPIVQNLMLGEHARAIQLMHETVGFQLGRTILRNMFGFDPRMAPFRDDPEIKALLAEPASGTKP